MSRFSGNAQTFKYWNTVIFVTKQIQYLSRPDLIYYYYFFFYLVLRQQYISAHHSKTGMIRTTFYIVVLSLLISIITMLPVRSARMLHLVRRGFTHQASPQLSIIGRPSNMSMGKMFMTTSDMSSGEDTVVSLCRKKIADMLNPVKLIVTSSNDDPNGSHVSLHRD